MVIPLLISYLVGLLLFGLPGFVLAGIGWWLSKRLKNVWGRACIRGGLVSMALVPTFYGHAGLVPAIIAVFRPPTPSGTTDWAAIAALAAGWLVAFGIIVWVERLAAT